MVQGNLWQRVNGQPRRAAASLTGKDVPTRPGVYAWHRKGEPVYAGRALGGDGLHGRIWKNQLKTGNDLSPSSFRTNVCEHIGIAPTSMTTVRPTVMTAADIEPVNRWIRECEVAWIEYKSASVHPDTARHDCQGLAYVLYGPIALCRQSDLRRSAVGKGVVPVPLPDPDVLAAVMAARDARWDTETAMADAVADARRAGQPWSAIGAVLDVSRQAAQQRFTRSAK